MFPLAKRFRCTENTEDASATSNHVDHGDKAVGKLTNGPASENNIASFDEMAE